MSSRGPDIDIRTARRLLGVDAGADIAAVTTAFREAALRTHPDRGGDAEAFREVLEAYRVLKDLPLEPLTFVPVPTAVRTGRVVISATVALFGGEALVDTADGRTLRLKLEPGMRPGQKVRAGEAVFVIDVRGDGVTVRGDDLWITAQVESGVLADGGRVVVQTPFGERTLWVNRRAAERGLVRLPGEGMPATGSQRQGDLFIRLTRGPDRAESAAKTLLRRFAAAWAA